jgi:hypothetical protein
MAEKAIHRQYVLDAGALIAHERRDPKVAALMEVAAEHRIEMILPSAVLAQVWRDGARQAILSRMLRNPGLVEAPLHHADAKRVGELLRDSGTSDVVDAHVAVLAGRLRVPVITSDPGDISRLNAAIELIRLLPELGQLSAQVSWGL